MTKNEFKCANCNGVFDKAWSDNEAMEESEALFGKTNPEDLAVICDDCFKEFNKSVEADLVEG